MRFVRNNTDDPRVMRDLAMLADEYGDGDGTAVALLDRPAADDGELPDDATNGEHAASTGVGEPSPLDDTFVRTFVRGTVHVRRYLPYYLGAAMWVLVMLLMAPRASNPTTEQAGFAFPETANIAPAGQTVESAYTDAAPAPSFADIGATPSDSGFTFEAPVAADAADGLASAPATEAPTFDASSFDTATTPSLSVTDEPKPLRITSSGYSSATAGTPLEQEPPGGGLPVGAAGGQATKRSFMKLSGDEMVLKLKLVEDNSNVGAEQAGIRACQIVVDGWKAERGQSFDTEPSWAEPCIDGTRAADGTWSFDLSAFGAPGTSAGFTLTPSEATGMTFNLTFSTSPVTSG